MTEPSPGPERTEVRELPEPRPGAGQVTIDVAYAGINFLDVMARRGDAGYVNAWPYRPGLEVAGHVREVGAGVTGLAVGDRVAAFTGSGGLAQVAVAASSLVVPLPDGVALPLAAAAPLMLSTALLLLTDVAGFRAGETVLMHSASGGVGSAVARLVSVLGGGLRIGTVGQAAKVTNAHCLGWDVAIVRDDHLTESVRAVAATGVDIVLDPLGASMIDMDLDVLAPGGRIALFGNPSGDRPAPLPPLGRLIGANATLAGFSMSRLTATAPARAGAALRRVVDLLVTGKLDLPVACIDVLGDVPGVHQLLAEGRSHGKFVVRLH
jgi:NADPH2:quinone reductase